jgi:hypothetical protein
MIDSEVRFLLHGQIRTVRELLKHHSHNLRMHRDVPRDNDIFSIIDVMSTSCGEWVLTSLTGTAEEYAAMGCRGWE